MKLKIVILLFAIGLLASPIHAQEDSTIGFSMIGLSLKSSGICLRAGGVYERLGAELYWKTDANTEGNDIMNMDGKPHRFSLMGGLVYRPTNRLLLAADVGYGSVGTYRVEATHTHYGVEGMTKGLEVGASVTLTLVIWAFSVGYSIIPFRNAFDQSYSEFTLCVGIAFGDVFD